MAACGSPCAATIRTPRIPDARLGTRGLLDHAQDVERAIHARDAKPIVMAYAIGGLLAQMLGSRGLARALVLLTPAPPARNAMILHPGIL